MTLSLYNTVGRRNKRMTMIEKEILKESVKIKTKEEVKKLKKNIDANKYF